MSVSQTYVCKFFGFWRRLMAKCVAPSRRYRVVGARWEFPIFGASQPDSYGQLGWLAVARFHFHTPLCILDIVSWADWQCLDLIFTTNMMKWPRTRINLVLPVLPTRLKKQHVFFRGWRYFFAGRRSCPRWAGFYILLELDRQPLELKWSEWYRDAICERPPKTRCEGLGYS